jgi:hypothetical protein
MMLALVVTLLLAASQSEWAVDRPLIEIVRSLKDRLDDPNQQLPSDMLRLLSAVDLTATLYARPREHYYQVTFTASYRRLRLVKTLEVWGCGSKTVVRSTVAFTRDSRCPLVDRLVWRIVPVIEARVLEFERRKLQEATR